MNEMNNQKLTELAAKAVGIVGTWHHGGFVAYSGWSRGTFDPLNDDGDALRLAVALGFVIDRNLADTIIYAGPWDSPKLGGVYVENGDSLSATRIAITRAAAQIGEDME